MINFHAILTFVYVLLISMHHSECDPASDLVILVDTFINQTSLNLIKPALVKFLDTLDIDFDEKTRVGMIEFGAESQTSRNLSKLSLRSDQNKQTLKLSKVMKMLGEFTSTSTNPYNLKNVGQALSFAHKLFKENPPRIHQSATFFTSKVALLFISDSGQINASSVYEEAERLKNDFNVEIFVYAIGNNIKQNEVKRISSFPHTLHSFFFKDYKDLFDRITEVTISSRQVPPFVQTNDRVTIQIDENEIRNFQVDTSSYVYDKNQFLVINMTHTQGVSLVYIDWLINTTSNAVSSVEFVRPGFTLLNVDDSTSHQTGQNNKGYLAFYEVPPLNSLRLYLKIVGVLPLNVFDLDLYRIDLPPF